MLEIKYSNTLQDFNLALELIIRIHLTILITHPVHLKVLYVLSVLHYATTGFSCYISGSITYNDTYLSSVSVQSGQVANELCLKMDIRYYDRNYGRVPGTYLEAQIDTCV